MLQAKYDEVEEKLETLCDKEDLEVEIYRLGFPITVTIKPQLGSQVSLFDSDNGVTTEVYKAGDEKREMQIIFDEDLTIKFIGGFVIDDDLLNKIRSLSKKLHYLWLQLFFMEKTKADDA